MNNYLDLFIFFKNLAFLNLIYLNVSFILCFILYYGNKFLNLQFFKFYTSVFFIKKLALFSLFVSFFLHILTFTLYFFLSKVLSNYVLSYNYLLIPNLSIFNFYINMSFDFFGLIILTLSYLVGFYSLLALDTRLYYKNIKYIFSFNFFIIIVYFYTTVSNLFLFFIFYECLLLPSFLVVYFVSSSKKAYQASLYFLIWTQIGSFIVLCCVSYLLAFFGGYDFFFLKNCFFSNYECWLIFFFLFIGFGIKIPIWPFHYWLTKTHVEAPAGFSMFLSGFLVKSAVFGFYKISTIMGNEIDTFLFNIVCIIGIMDSSLKMWGQTDLKKLVAYGTIQEMNLIFLVFCWGDVLSIIGGILFCLMHSILSTLMFFLVDCIQKRFHSRSTVELSGILHLTPNLGISILFMCIFYSGIPGTLKFTSEFYIFSGFFDSSPFLCFFIMLVANVIGLIGFSKPWFNVTFGMMVNINKYLPLDLTLKELFNIFSCFFLLFFSCFYFIFLL
uniref:NADH dehydrogenase subunit 4 n=1 Tax=Cryptocaryon irritans TaxID=153251 RepID=UPI0022FD844E|nr:NADH dehydrogenase subunit 4 [Cryptocaryon irritans]WBP62308.1 NADH dehydrogenase subunit 4 [Cryptocaryon irritans]